MIGIRQKLFLGFGGLLLIVVAIGVLTIRHIDDLGGAIDVILKQNYRSVVACRNVTESLDQIDRGVLFTFAGHYNEGIYSIRKHEQGFRNALQVERGNITLPGEYQNVMQIKKLTASVEEIRKGNLDLVLDTTSLDEIGQLSRSFNDMAATLRRIRKSDRDMLHRSRRATQEVFKVLPLPIAVLDANGLVELSTDTAEHYFGLKPGSHVYDLGHEWLTEVWQKAVRLGHATEPEESPGYIQHFEGRREFFFQPVAVPVPLGSDYEEFAGTALIFRDVTQLHEHLEHLFERFYRVPGQKATSGIGLGLSIVKEIVEAHGGSVGADNVAGKGSVFYFTLPIQQCNHS